MHPPGPRAGRELVGVTCLARGADQIFARVVLTRATTVHTMPAPASNRDAYLAASEHVLANIDEMIAVWDGAPPDGKGGTGDAVHTARQRQIPVTVVWPPGASRA